MDQEGKRLACYGLGKFQEWHWKSIMVDVSFLCRLSGRLGPPPGRQESDEEEETERVHKRVSCRIIYKLL